jgi:hypothetical protein
LKGACKKAETAITLNSATQVVDSNGNIVGQAYGGFALRQIDGVWVAPAVTTNGFVETGAFSSSHDK